MHSPPATAAGLSQPIEKHLAIILVFKNPLTPVPAGHHMVNRPGILETQ
jgi:hypothetical protein